MANSNSGKRCLYLNAKGKRPREFDHSDCESSNRKENCDRPTKSEGCTPNNGGRSMKDWLQQLTTTMRENKLNPPNNIAAEMVALLNRHSETNLIMSKLHEDYHLKAESAPCVIGSSHKISSDKATIGSDDIPETKIPKVIVITYSAHWMPVLFRPPSTMRLSDMEAEIASYIFMGADILSSKENLVISLDGLEIGDRQTLMTLRPTSYVCTEVIMMVVCLLTHYKNLLCDYASCWFLPPQFSERALNEKNSTAEISKEYIYPFIGFVDKIKKEYIIVINCIYLFLSMMRVYIGTWCNDCGVQVAKWMMECISHNNYQSIGVNGESRMRLALDLVLDRHNQIRKFVVQNASDKIKLFKQEWKILDDY
ncbi:hypothetical protein SESBI_29222 [Sesbania bispinosa]|nr:hypothetical protein SESBI_29222 [Sesbania bispinosa]